MDYFCLVNDLQKLIDQWISDGEELSLAYVSDRCGYSKWHMQRIFRDVSGVNLGTYIRLRRLHFAAEAIRYTDENILNISIRYGFTSQQVFSRIFKSIYHRTPRDFRKHYSIKCNTDVLKCINDESMFFHDVDDFIYQK